MARDGSTSLCSALPGEQQRAAFAAELFVGEPAHRQQRHARELEQPARPEREREARRAAHRRDRRGHGVEQRVGDALVLAYDVAPRVAVAGRVLLE